MSEVPQIEFDRLIKLVTEGRQIPSVEVLIGGEYKGTWIAPTSAGGASLFDEIRTHADSLGVRSNIPLTRQAYDNLKLQPIADKYPALTKAREARRAKREAALAAV